MASHNINEESMKRLIVHIASSERAFCRKTREGCFALDVYSAKLSCKNFNKIAQDNQILEEVNISKISLVSWLAGIKLSRLLEHCRARGNVRDLYRQGMCDHFVEATYVYSTILVHYGVDLRQKGLELLHSLNRHKSKGLSETESREEMFRG